MASYSSIHNDSFFYLKKALSARKEAQSFFLNQRHEKLEKYRQSLKFSKSFVRSLNSELDFKFPFTAPEKPVILTGCQSSGTTFLANILGAHPQSGFSNEAGIMRVAIIWFKHVAKNSTSFRSIRFVEFLNTINMLRNPKRKPRLTKLREKTEDIIKGYQQDGRLFNWIEKNEVNEFIRNLAYDVHNYNVEEPLLWGDKYPEYILFLEDLEEIFYDCSWIFIIRNPWATMGSLWERRGIKPDQKFKKVHNELRFSVEDARDQWSSWNLEWLKFRNKVSPSRRLEIKYEDLIAEPWTVLKSIEEFLQIEFIEHPKVQKVVKQTDSTKINHWQNRKFAEELTNCSITDDMEKVARYFGYM